MACRAALRHVGLLKKPAEDEKVPLLQRLRDTLDDQALLWLDATLVMTERRDKPHMAPLLGTGGNDGRLEFSNNHMQRLVKLILEQQDSRTGLCASLYGDAARSLERGAVGQFHPAAAGSAGGRLPGCPAATGDVPARLLRGWRGYGPAVRAQVNMGVSRRV